MIGQLSENSIARRARVEEFRDAKVFPGLIGYHSEGSLASTEITITKKHDLKGACNEEENEHVWRHIPLYNF